MTTWRQLDNALTYTIGRATATIRRDGSRFTLEVKRDGRLVQTRRGCSLGGAQRMGVILVQENQ